MPAATPPGAVISVVLQSRGGGRERTLNLPNYASSTDRITVQLDDFERFAQEDDEGDEG